MVSIIIPAYKEPFLQQTIDSLLESATGEIEIIVILNGYIPPVPIKTNPKVTILTIEKNEGMKQAFNLALSKAKGEYLMRVDAHCLFGQGFDEIMSKNCKDNWLIVPRRYSLDEVNWKRDESRHIVDYFYITPPQVTKYGYGIDIVRWLDKTQDRLKGYDIDDLMTFEGSCWFANRKYFMERVKFLDPNPQTYGHWHEQFELGFKYWFFGGEVKIIKTTWYAHLMKRAHHYNAGMFYRKTWDSLFKKQRSWCTRHWMNNEEPNMIHPFSWLIKKFNPPGWKNYD
jgi:glycosyltransferase involved in cell wall biosynthesis